MLTLEQFDGIAHATFDAAVLTSGANAEMRGSTPPMVLVIVTSLDVEGANSKNCAAMAWGANINPHAAKALLLQALKEVETEIQHGQLAQPAANELPC